MEWTSLDGATGITLLLVSIFAAMAAAAAAAAYGARLIPLPARWTGPAAAACALIALVLSQLDELELLPFDPWKAIIGVGALGTVLFLSYSFRRGAAKARKVEARLDLKCVATFPLRTFEGTRGPFLVRLVIGTGDENEGPYETLEISVPSPALGEASFRVLRSWQELPLGALAKLLLPAPGPAAWARRWKILSRPRRAAERLLRVCPPPADDGRFRFVDASAGAGRLSVRWRAERVETDDIDILCARAGEWRAALSQAPVI